MAHFSKSRSIAALERDELLARIDEREAAVRRHTIWAVLGVSPGAVIPLFLTLGQMGWLSLLIAMVLMVVWELFKAGRARAEANELREELRRLDDEGCSPTPSPPL